MWLFKLFGMVFVFSACTLFGFLKSASLRKRADKLWNFGQKTDRLKECIRIRTGEIGTLLPKVYGKDLLFVKDGEFIPNKDYLLDEDFALLSEFFSSLGMGDITSECERIESYSKIIKSRSNQAYKECESLCRLYKSIGALVGVFICIFLM